jgi:hypothetical protein
MSKTLVLLVLAVVWGVALIPPLLRSRVHHRPVSSVTSFRRQLSNLSRMPESAQLSPSRAFHAPTPRRTTGAAARRVGSTGYTGLTGSVANAPYLRSNAAVARSIARRRRQNVLLTLTAVVLVSGLAWLGFAVAVARAVFFVSLIALGLYVYLLVMLRRAEEVRVGASPRPYVYSDAA